MRLPRRSWAWPIGPSALTVMVMRGDSTMAPTAITGAPLATMASSGPELSPISMLLAAMPCCSRALPVNDMDSIESPCLAKIPAAIPTSSGMKDQELAMARPTRRLSWARALVAATPGSAAKASSKASRGKGFRDESMAMRGLSGGSPLHP
jgi:hypothetical protein